MRSSRSAELRQRCQIRRHNLQLLSSASPLPFVKLNYGLTRRETRRKADWCGVPRLGQRVLFLKSSIPNFDDAILSIEGTDALRAKFYTGALPRSRSCHDPRVSPWHPSSLDLSRFCSGLFRTILTIKGRTMRPTDMAAIHSDEFKRDAVRTAQTSGPRRRQVASDLGFVAR